MPTELVTEPPAGEPAAAGQQAGTSAPWWRSRPAIAAAAALVVVLGAGSALLLSGGNGAQQPGTLIFSSDFTSASDGWKILRAPADGHANAGTYYIRPTTSNAGATAVPANASSVYPSAPQDIRIDVSAQVVKGPLQLVQYGVVCRDNSSGAYLFQLQGSRATIAKDIAGTYTPLRSVSASVVNVGGVNQLSAECANVAGQQAVRLTFLVNGTRLLQVTDRSSQLSSGTVGIFANYYHILIPNGVEAAFRNPFWVRQL